MDKSQNTEDLPALWNDIATALKTELSPDAYVRWFKDIELLKIDDKQLTLRVPNNIFQLWIESNYLPLLRGSIMLVLGSPRSVHFVHADDAIESGAVPAKSGRHAPVIDEPPDEPTAPSAARNGVLPMNPRNTFEAFVVGAGNQFAHAACLAVSEAPARAYNPLFIYGGTGLGKTHLMNAIGHHIAGKRKPSKILYITSEVFTNEFIDAIQNGTLMKFRKRYRQADVLLIDDIQFLAGKERSQEEFFHTFNTLFDGHKQIVLSSDRPPSEFENLEQRLVSRFDWGLTAELLPLDVETRVAILRKKAAAMDVRLPDEAIQFIADRVRTNVRRLEGALTRVASYAALTGKKLNVEMVEGLLRELLHEEGRFSVNIEVIQKKVAEHFDIRLADMTSKRRPENIAFR